MSIGTGTTFLIKSPRYFARGYERSAFAHSWNSEHDFNSRADMHLVVAPHEFFLLGPSPGARLRAAGVELFHVLYRAMADALVRGETYPTPCGPAPSLTEPQVGGRPFRRHRHRGSVRPTGAVGAL